MKNAGKIAGGVVLGLLILGAGCADQSSNEPMTKDADTPTIELQTPPTDTTTSTTMTATTTPTPEAKVENGMQIITLQGEAVGNGSVKLSWSTAEKMNDSNRFIIVRSAKENPENTGKNHWNRLNYTKTDTVWADQPAGVQHYRICITQNKNNDLCIFYSNDVQVEVK